MEIEEVAGKVQDFIEKRFSGSNNKVDRAYEYSVSNRGKMLRPMIVSAVAQAYNVSPEIYVPCAAVVEIMNTATLVLDDMPFMDDAELRRGKPTTWKKFGEQTASLVVPYSFGKIMEILAGVKLTQETKDKIYLALGRTAIELSKGQQMDLSDLTARPTEKKILECYHLKAGSLIACAAKVGAYVGGAGDPDIRHLGNFGYSFGVAFQIADDAKDNLKPEITGKSSGKDRGKITLSKKIGVESAIKMYDGFMTLAVGSIPKERDFSKLQELVSVARDTIKEGLFRAHSNISNGQQVRSN